MSGAAAGASGFDIGRMSLLVVEDHPVIRMVIGKLLRTAPFDLTLCENAEQAHAALQRQSWDVLLTDLHLGGQGGEPAVPWGIRIIERACEMNPQIQCVLMTAWGEQENFSRAVRLGVERILLKPVGREELLGVLTRLDDNRRTRAVLAHAERELEAKRRTLERLRQREQRFGVLVQEALLSDIPARPVEGIELRGEIRPLHAVGGDIIDVAVRSPGNVDILLGDVMGKDYAAALLSAGVKATLAGIPSSSVTRSVDGLRRRLGPLLRELDSFVTCVFMRVDAGLGYLEFVDCGAPRVLIQRRQLPGTAMLAHGQMMPLGLEEGPLSRVRLPLYPGDRVLLLSDGIVDGIGAADVDAAYEEIAGMFGAAPVTQPGLCELLMARSEGRNGYADDRTCLLLHYAPDGHAPDGHAPGGPARHAVAAHAFDGRMSSLAAFREWLRGLFSGHPPLPREWLDGLILGATEVLTNVVRHALHDRGAASPVHVLAGVGTGACWLEWHYQGRPFSKERQGPVKLPEPESLSESGYGMYLIEQLFDEVQYFTEHARLQTVVAMRAFPAGG